MIDLPADIPIFRPTAFVLKNSWPTYIFVSCFWFFNKTFKNEHFAFFCKKNSRKFHPRNLYVCAVTLYMSLFVCPSDFISFPFMYKIRLSIIVLLLCNASKSLAIKWLDKKYFSLQFGNQLLFSFLPQKWPSQV